MCVEKYFQLQLQCETLGTDADEGLFQVFVYPLCHQTRMLNALTLDIQRSVLSSRLRNQVRIRLLSGDRVAWFNIVNITAESDIYSK